MKRGGNDRAKEKGGRRQKRRGVMPFWVLSLFKKNLFIEVFIDVIKLLLFPNTR